jgi:CubicO group peptidase (beta-lactamase class C family)
MEQIAFLRPNAPFRSAFTYSNFNYASIAYVVELLTGKSYNEVLDELIFQPLGLDASSNFTQLVEQKGEYSQGWIRQGINYTECTVDATAAVNSTDPAVAASLPASCAGELGPIDFWSKGAGQEFGGGGNVIATGNDLVCHPFRP